MQEDFTPSMFAIAQGHTETLALLLANKADVNAANKVQQFNILKY
jgi:ankyrin repeat protein